MQRTDLPLKQLNQQNAEKNFHQFAEPNIAKTAPLDLLIHRSYANERNAVTNSCIYIYLQLSTRRGQPSRRGTTTQVWIVSDVLHNSKSLEVVKREDKVIDVRIV
ncbi:hypothetical protein L484_014111 [Morus notabilis]|uniref:Uncharacterized protein n=1 Tax=Morus notabilis TaxID=981085 RepID=W9SNW5_9ROSA|nr:hypothetical protein L484_014111 [Morus notabilis]